VEDVIAEREQIVELAGELVNRLTSRLRDGAILNEIDAGVEAEAESAPAVTPAASQAQREALDLHLRAHHEWQDMERHRMKDAMGRLLRAIELDPALMAARVELAQLVILQNIYGYLSPRIAAAAVRRAADGIPELNEQ